jgi:hypothetical protein
MLGSNTRIDYVAARSAAALATGAAAMIGGSDGAGEPMGHTIHLRFSEGIAVPTRYYDRYFRDRAYHLRRNRLPESASAKETLGDRFR